MKARCYAPCNRNMGYYQKENIQVCERWRDSFENFVADMGMMPSDDCSIERLDYHKDYCPENCIWIPQAFQQKNRRNVPIYEHNGKRMCLKDWSRELGIPYDRIRGRLRKGASFEEAIKSDLYNRQVTINGKSQTVTKWCEEFGLNKGNVFSRIHRGWSKEDALLKHQERIRK